MTNYPFPAWCVECLTHYWGEDGSDRFAMFDRFATDPEYDKAWSAAVVYFRDLHTGHREMSFPPR